MRNESEGRTRYETSSTAGRVTKNRGIRRYNLGKLAENAERSSPRISTNRDSRLAKHGEYKHRLLGEKLANSPRYRNALQDHNNRCYTALTKYTSDLPDYIREVSTRDSRGATW
jgi:hypothetical protein